MGNCRKVTSARYTSEACSKHLLLGTPGGTVPVGTGDDRAQLCPEGLEDRVIRGGRELGDVGRCSSRRCEAGLGDQGGFMTRWHSSQGRRTGRCGRRYGLRDYCCHLNPPGSGPPDSLFQSTKPCSIPSPPAHSISGVGWGGRSECGASFPPQEGSKLPRPRALHPKGCHF